jgi:invasion protein IalB
MWDGARSQRFAGWILFVVTTGVAFGTPLGSQTGKPTSTPGVLPGGASALQETHGDWAVACTQPAGKKVCTFSQQQMDKETRQRMLAIELSPAVEKADGTLLLPFGLAVAREVIVQIGETTLGMPLRFRTCLPAGCVVPLSFGPREIGELRKGKALTVRATGDGGQPAVFTISLEGFASAMDRTAALAK